MEYISNISLVTPMADYMKLHSDLMKMKCFESFDGGRIKEWCETVRFYSIYNIHTHMIRNR